MQLIDFPLFDETLFTFNYQNNHQLVENEPFELIYQTGQYLVHQNQKFVEVQPRQINEVFLRLQRNDFGLWLLENICPDQIIVKFLPLENRINQDITLSVDNKIVDDLFKKKLIEKQEIQAALNWVQEEFIANQKFLFAKVFDQRNDSNHFVIIGKNKSADIQRQPNDVWQISRITPIRRSYFIKLLLIIGKFEVLDDTIAANLASLDNQALLDASIKEYGDYIQLWNEYSQLELQQAQNKAKELDVLPYGTFQIFSLEDKSYRLTVASDQAREFFQRWKQLNLRDDTRVNITIDKPNWDMEDNEIANWHGTLKFNSSFDHVDFIPEQNDKINSKLPKQGFISLSLSGNVAIQKRRELAREKIASRRNLPQLQNYLQNLVVLGSQRRKIINELTTYIKSSFRGGNPTPKQAQAILVAMNTPDIALIVGAPGTGKTQVITALQRGLAELADPKVRTPQPHQVLVSSFQHDAVDNVLKRSDVFGLPAIRVGGKHHEEQTDRLFTHWINNQCKQVQKNIEAQQRIDSITPLFQQFNKQLLIIRLSKLSIQEYDDALFNLQTILDELAVHQIELTKNLAQKWQQCRQKYQQQQSLVSDSLRNSLIRQIRALRLTEKAFADDGANSAYYLLQTIKRKKIDLNPMQMNLLDNMANLMNGEIPSENELVQLSELKNKLLDQFFVPTFRPTKINQIVDDEVLTILTEIETHIQGKLLKNKNSLMYVLMNYQQTLLNEPDAIRATINEYANVIGATCQQAGSKKMGNIKKISSLGDCDVLFDTVIIDEAARANPLDLFVPMSMAKQRIILVGDDRQLPHLLQQELEDELVETNQLSEREQEAYRQSLFERLRKQLEKQEQEDGIQRVVMLDTQYRMHPTLGEFVSQNFYENVGLDKIYSGRSVEDFQHHIKGYIGRCAAWIDVPIEKGLPEKHGTSWARPAEAHVIAKEVKRLADECASSVSIGVITFYSAQEFLIKQELEKLGIVVRLENGVLDIAPDYRSTDKGEERIRIGTVDAFQGKEFDVVFLSVVRAGKNNKRQYSFGHLSLANRLNVAVSRQRKLLVVVGEQALAASEQAREKVPALYAFLALCEREKQNG